MKQGKILGVALCAMLLIGCATQTVPGEEALTVPETTVTIQSAETQAPQATPEPAAVESAAPGKTIEPLAPTLSVDDLKDCTFAAGFEAADVYLNGDGALVVRMTVYDRELYDLVDVSQLAQGDVLVTGGESVTITALERSADGRVLINGGFDADGITLATDENGVYYAVGDNDAPQYRVVGEAVLPVDQEFILQDSSELGQPEQISYAGDFLMNMEAGDRSFSPYDTTVTVQDGFLRNITVIDVP